MTASDLGKRIPKTIDSETYAIGTYTLTDLTVGVIPGVIVIMVMQFFVSPTMTVGGYRVTEATLPLTCLAIACGGLVVALTPAHLTTVQWVGLVTGFQTRSTRLPHDAATEHTQVEALHLGDGVIERTDGALVGFIAVTPPPMALATNAEWRRKANGFRDFLNAVVEFPIQVYSTTRPFPVDAYLQQYESRLDDPSVESNPRLAKLIDEYVSWYRDSRTTRELTCRDHYVVVSVAPSEVRFERDGLVGTLSSIAVIGGIIERFAPRPDGERQAMVDALSDRLTRVEHGLSQIEGCDARRLDVSEATELIATFWEGEEVRYGETQHAIAGRCLNGRQK
ncbi:hypothetical protein [Salinigranum halophilum]|uniref:hypothetical protein n=1 Tax=Salinigranum halophilum TaxID=2565931 RepID=UPI00115F6A07|nr:hypothetical protein [Salinigranum halophilum]